MSKMNFDIKFDRTTGIAHERIEGQFTPEFYLEKYHQAYVDLKSTQIKHDPWAKLIDMRDYIPSAIVDTITVHAVWLKDNNCTHIAMVMPKNVTATMQMRRVSNNNGLNICITESIEDAKAWLAENGYK